MMIVMQDTSVQTKLINSLLYLLARTVLPFRKGNTGRTNCECAIIEIIIRNNKNQPAHNLGVQPRLPSVYKAAAESWCPFGEKK